MLTSVLGSTQRMLLVCQRIGKVEKWLHWLCVIMMQTSIAPVPALSWVSIRKINVLLFILRCHLIMKMIMKQELHSHRLSSHAPFKWKLRRKTPCRNIFWSFQPNEFVYTFFRKNERSHSVVRKLEVTTTKTTNRLVPVRPYNLTLTPFCKNTNTYNIWHLLKELQKMFSYKPTIDTQFTIENRVCSNRWSSIVELKCS